MHGHYGNDKGKHYKPLSAQADQGDEDRIGEVDEEAEEETQKAVVGLKKKLQGSDKQ